MDRLTDLIDGHENKFRIPTVIDILDENNKKGSYQQLYATHLVCLESFHSISLSL